MSINALIIAHKKKFFKVADQKSAETSGGGHCCFTVR